MSAKKLAKTTSKSQAVFCDSCHTFIANNRFHPYDQQARDGKAYCLNCAYRPNPVQPAIEFVIQRNSLHHCWQATLGFGAHSIWQLPLADYTDPLDVADWLKNQISGPINVVVNL